MLWSIIQKLIKVFVYQPKAQKFLPYIIAVNICIIIANILLFDCVHATQNCFNFSVTILCLPAREEHVAKFVYFFVTRDEITLLPSIPNRYEIHEKMEPQYNSKSTGKTNTSNRAITTTCTY